jgi:hypothetical protein
MRTLVLALTVCGSSALAAAACSSGHGAQPSLPDAAVAGPDAAPSVDAGSVDAGPTGDEPPPTPGNACGSPPYVTLGIVVVGLSLTDPNGTPLAGVELTSPLCPGIVETSDEAGTIEGQIQQNAAFYARLQADNYMPELTPEEIFDASSTGTHVLMLPTLVQGLLLPDFEAGVSTAIFVAAQGTTDAGPCASFDGITFTVPGHPEAQITYYSNDSIPAPVPDAGATTARGLAIITGLAAGQLVTLAAAKAGCHVALQYSAFTGRAPLEPGFVTLAPAYVTP